MEITLGSIISYLVGIPLVLLSVLLTIQTPIGLIPLIAGLLILPPLRRQLAKRTGIKFSKGAAGGIGVIGIISCLVVLILVVFSGGGGSVPGADVSNVSVTAQDASPANPSTSLQVVWNARAQSAVDPDPDDMSIYNSNDGEKYLVVRMRVTNSGDEPIELDPQLFGLESEGVVYEYQALFGSGNSLSGVSLNPDASYSAWTAFSVPDETSNAQIVVNQEAYYQKNISVTFSHDDSMPINMSD